MLRNLLIVSAAAVTSLLPRNAMPAAVEPAAAATGAINDAAELAAITDQLIAHRSDLALDDRQLRLLASLAADVRRQESDWYYRAERCATSKPWLRGPCLTSLAQVRSAALAILRPDQRQRALTVLAAAAEPGQS